MLIAGIAIKLPRLVDRQARVHERRVLLDFRIAVAAGDDRARRRIGGIAGDAQILIAAAGGIAGEIFAGDRQEAIGAERQARPAGHRSRRAVVLVALQMRGFDAGEILTVCHAGAAAFAGFAQAQVDHARDRVRAVLRRRALAQHFDRTECGCRDRVHIDRGGAATDGVVDVDQRGGVRALGIDQHQRFVRRETAQRGGAHRVRAVSDRGAGKIQRGQGNSQRLSQFC